jgi:hypothetical protein
VALLRRLPAEPVPRATEDAVIARSHDDPPDLPPPLRPPRG